jgi:hypothetical protein
MEEDGAKLLHACHRNRGKKLTGLVQGRLQPRKRSYTSIVQPWQVRNIALSAKSTCPRRFSFS